MLSDSTRAFLYIKTETQERKLCCLENVPINKLSEPLRKLITTDFHLSDDEKKLKSLLESYIQDLEVSVKNLSQKCAEFSVTQYDHFANIRREIDIKRETIIKEIYERFYEEDEGVDNNDDDDVDEVEEDNKYKNELQFNANNEAKVSFL